MQNNIDVTIEFNAPEPKSYTMTLAFVSGEWIMEAVAISAFDGTNTGKVSFEAKYDFLQGASVDDLVKPNVTTWLWSNLGSELFCMILSQDKPAMVIQFPNDGSVKLPFPDPSTQGGFMEWKK